MMACAWFAQQHMAAWRCFNSWRVFIAKARCEKAWVPISVQMAAAAAEVQALEMESRGRKRGRRGLSEPRLARFEKRELIERLHDTWSRHAQNYWLVAQSKCEAAKEWYESMAEAYVQARDKESVLELGLGGHLLDHRYQTKARISQLEPCYDAFDSGIASAFATCVTNLGRIAHHDREVQLARKLQELECYCKRLEQHNDRLNCQLLAVEQGSCPVWLS